MRLRWAVALICVAVAGLLCWVLVRTPPTGSADFVAPIDPTRPRPQGDAYCGAFHEPAHLNPFTTSDHVALSYVLRFTHDCLMAIDLTSGALVPALAEVSEASPDGLRFDFALRDGVRFSDGTPVTVEDVRFTHEVLQDRTVPAGSIASAVGQIAAFETLDARRFRITLRARHFAGLAAMAIGYRVVQRRWFVQRIAELAAARGVAVPDRPGAPEFGRLLAAVRLPGPSTGPYRLAVDRRGAPVWRAGTELWLVQNPSSWQRRAFPERWNLAAMRLRFGLDEPAQFVALRAQQLDWVLPPDLGRLLADHPDLLEHYRAVRYDSAVLGQYLVVWNHQRPALRDARVRRALTRLFDRRAIAEELLGGDAVVASSWFKQGTPEYGLDPPWAFDPKLARAELAAAGYGNGQPNGPLRITLVGDRGQARYRRMVELAQGAFRDAGVELRGNLMEWGAALAARERGEFDGFLMYWSHSPEGVDPFEFFHSNPTGAPGGHNRMRYHDAEVDALLVTARRELDATKRIELLQRFNLAVHRDQPVTLLVHPRNALLLHRRFEDAVPGFTGMVPERWWVKPDQRRYHLRHE
ncbi:MAG: hypothetical protein H6836_04110 [Planctomycetes bacterium]|nr:hypothetical protein [Planctomycetota bacterium]